VVDLRYDDLFVYAPSILLEGKALGTAKMRQIILSKDKIVAKDWDLAAFAKARQVGQTVGKRVLEKVQGDTKAELIKVLKKFIHGHIDEREMRQQVVRRMKVSWREVFLAGLRAGGTEGEGSGKGKVLVKLDTGDDLWVRSAMQHEMRFLNRFLDAVVNEAGVMPYDRRAEMYVDALESFYDSARVISLPYNTRIWWKGPHDHRTCESCRYMFERSPFTKFSLPTTPRAGMTLCLTNCRDMLFVKRVAPEEASIDVKSLILERARHVRHLRKIKREGHL